MSENEIIKITEKTFEKIKHTDENGNEYWLARELMSSLGYSSWDKFKKVIEKAIISCKNSGSIDTEHFSLLGKSLNLPNGATNYINDYDYNLSRYACYLIAQNGSPTKKSIAPAQTYFAVKTRQQELTEDEYKQLSEDEKRLYNRITVKNRNKYLFDTAKEAGVKDKVGKAVRDTIKKLGGTMPENLPTPKKSIKELEKEKKKQLRLADKKKLLE